MNLEELKKMRISELTKLAKEFKIDGIGGLKKQELIFAILQANIEESGQVFGEGTFKSALPLRQAWATMVLTNPAPTEIYAPR